jgi:antirestriction protein
MTAKHDTTLNPRVYVACLGCYTAGRLHGEWFEADEEMPGAVAEFFGTRGEDEPTVYCARSGGEEFVVHDDEGFGALELGECDYSTAARVGQWVRDLDEDDNAGWLAGRADLVTHLHVHLYSASDLDPEHLRRSADFARDEYQGEFDSLEDWAADYHEEVGTVPQGFKLATYIDWERVARDAELGGDVFTVKVGGKVHVFWNR